MFSIDFKDYVNILNVVRVIFLLFIYDYFVVLDLIMSVYF